MTKRLGISALVVLITILFMPAASRAAFVTYGPVSHGFATTNWSTNLSLPKWDPALFPGQVLTGISFTLDGFVEGNAAFESLDAAPATVDMNLQATITLTDPLANVLATVIPVASTSDNVTAHDGTIDFGGTSGKAYTGLSGNDSDTGSSGAFALFTGPGNILLPTDATGTSNGSGAGNLLLQFSTSARAEASITYTYEPVPEPASVVLAAIGLVGLVGYGIRRRRAG